MRKILFYVSVLILTASLLSCSSEPKEASEEQAALFFDVTGFALVGWLIGGDGVDMVTTDEGFRVLYKDYPIDEEGTGLLTGMVVYEKVEEGDYYEVALGVLVEAADYVQQRGLSAAARAEYGDKFALAEADADPAQRVDGHVARDIVLANVLQCEQMKSTLSTRNNGLDYKPRI